MAPRSTDRSLDLKFCISVYTPSGFVLRKRLVPKVPLILLPIIQSVCRLTLSCGFSCRLFIAAGSALLAYYVMQARMEVAIAKEREVLAEARAEDSNPEKHHGRARQSHRAGIPPQGAGRVHAGFPRGRAPLLPREQVAHSRKKSMVLQERLYFRNIPLSNWVEHEMVVEEEGADIQHIAKGCSVFSTKACRRQQIRTFAPAGSGSSHSPNLAVRHSPKKRRRGLSISVPSRSRSLPLSVT